MSPYEALLLTDPCRRIGLCAQLPPGSEIAGPSHAGVAERLSRGGLEDLRLFTIVLPGRTLVFLYVTTGVDAGGIPASLASDPWWKELTAQTIQGWRRMEFINLVAHLQVFPHPPGVPVERLALVSRLRPDHEAAYRSLHQTNWPGVVDQMVRSHYRAWTTFLTEIDGDLLLFTTVEHHGSDRRADDAATAADPVTRRWWRHTEPCLEPVLPSAGNWAPMRPVI